MTSIWCRNSWLTSVRDSYRTHVVAGLSLRGGHPAPGRVAGQCPKLGIGQGQLVTTGHPPAHCSWSQSPARDTRHGAARGRGQHLMDTGIYSVPALSSSYHTVIFNHGVLSHF